MTDEHAHGEDETDRLEDAQHLLSIVVVKEEYKSGLDVLHDIASFVGWRAIADYSKYMCDLNTLEDEWHERQPGMMQADDNSFPDGPVCNDYNECGCGGDTPQDDHCMYCLHPKRDHVISIGACDDAEA